MKKIKNVKNYWPLVKEMSQVTFLLVIGFAFVWAGFEKAKTPDMQFASFGGAFAAFLFSIVPMYLAMAKSLLPKKSK